MGNNPSRQASNGHRAVNYRDLVSGLRRLEIDPARPVIAHASLSAFGEVQGGAETVVGALSSAYRTLVMPTFTYKTMLIPEAGPPDNAMKYGRGKDTNRMTEFYRPDMPADRMMGAVAESLRRHPGARRSHHPILSFAGLNADRALDAQSLAEPMAPIQVLTEAWGWVLLLGVDYRANTSVHYAERKAGRKQFIRWALTPKGSCECPGFPGCSDGFPALAPRLEAFTRRVQVGRAAIQAISLPDLVEAASRWIASDPLALLCERLDCGRCQAIRVVYSSRLRR